MNDITDPEFSRSGQAVRITTGPHTGQTGKISYETGNYVVVCLPPFNRLAYVDPDGIELLPGHMDRYGVYHTEPDRG